MNLVTKRHRLFPAPWLTGIAFALFWHSSTSAAGPDQGKIQFNRDIRPILSVACFVCHGPDTAKRKADLRLDDKSSVYADRDGYQIVTPNNPDDSELYTRIISDDPDLQMPPPDSDITLTAQQKYIIRRWIEQGATWQKHWSFITPAQPKHPALKNSDWAKNSIDAFILARLEKEGLKPSQPASRETLIRRVSFDITGLPPSIEEIDAFLNDRSPNAYEKVVDRLLKSKRYGERMAAEWLDAARFADTSGYQSDGPRYMWRWRDWVIDAYNQNMPFDQFTIEQIAGDMLPNPTLQQRIATGFNRNHRGNAEGGLIPEEFAVEYVVDRIETTSTVWLGLTLGCTRCHEHKYDPFSQQEFYKLFSYFNNLPEHGRALKEGNSPPYIKAPTNAQQKKLLGLDSKLAAAKKHFQSLQPEIATAQQAWENSFSSNKEIDWSVTDGLIALFSLDQSFDNSIKSTTPKNPKEPKKDEKPPEIPGIHDGTAAFTAGKLNDAGQFDGKRFITAGDIAHFDYFDKFTLAAWVHPQGNHGGTIISQMKDVVRGDGYSLTLIDGKLHVNLVKRWLDDSIRVETKSSVPVDQWFHVAVTYDGTRVAKGITVYINGEQQPLKINLDYINQTFTSSEPLRIGAGSGPESRFQGLIDDVRVYNRSLKPSDIQLVSTPESITKILSLAAEKRAKNQSAKLRAYYLASHAPKHLQQAARKTVKLSRQRFSFFESIPTVMIMQEMETPRDAFLLVRGEYNNPAEKVAPGVPATLPDLPKGVENNRLGFAKWLVDPAHPLTARVTINRLWQQIFGLGLVKTTEDFGSQGELPSHPELLDWLATEFIRTGWDVKEIQKTIFTSATYQQSSKVSPDLFQKDPENRLLARGPRFRLSAEMVRDQALTASGLLVEKLGGPSVKPYQPAGLWKEIASTTNYDQSTGSDLYRRSLYTYWKRTVAPPSMMNFDAAAREMCQVRPSRTNTPLQALNLMNDVTFVEAARALAERIMTPTDKSPDQRLTRAFRLATSRRPQPAELAVLVASYEFQQEHYSKNIKTAKKLIQTGESKPNEKLDPAELAAYTTVTGLILNLDEVITKE
ncbi:MAG: DUF1553 domain-containing protein [Pirellulales bacterium]